MRVILYTGKGGVGKTSIAAATGLELARRGTKTLVMSVDPAHSLSDAFDLEKPLMDRERGKLVYVRPNLWMQEVDVQEEIQDHWEDVYVYLASLLNISGLDEILAEELAIFPGMEEVSSLLYVNQYVREKQFDVILLDCAPTGESLRFVSIPTTLEWYMNKIFKVERKVAKMVRPMMQTLTKIPLPDDSYFQNIEHLHQKLHGVDHLLVDPTVTTVRLVTNPEKVVLKETQRAFMYFCLYGMTIDAIIVNRILSSEIQDRFFSAWKETQERHIASIEEFFAPVPILRLDLFKDEVLGVKDLVKVGRQLYGDKDPAAIYYGESAYQFKKVNGKYQLRVKLPFVSSDEIQLYKRFDELVIRIGGFKRHLQLPQRMAHTEPLGAKITDGTLLITFGGKDAGTEKRRPAQS